MFSWLFGKKKKPKKVRPAELRKPKSSRDEPKNVRVIEEQKWEPKSKDSEEIMTGMGGAETLALVIKDMLAEDRRKRKGK